AELARARSGAQRGDRLLATRMRRHALLEPGDVEDPLDLVADSAEGELPVELLPGPHEQGDAGRVDELAAAQIDQQGGGRIREGPLQLPLELGGGVHVELALDDYHDHTGVLFAANLERGRVQESDDATGASGGRCSVEGGLCSVEQNIAGPKRLCFGN